MSATLHPRDTQANTTLIYAAHQNRYRRARAGAAASQAGFGLTAAWSLNDRCSKDKRVRVSFVGF